MNPLNTPKPEKATEAEARLMLVQALVASQAAFPEIPKNRQGHAYKYADLADVLGAVRPVLNENGLAIYQEISGEFVKTTLAHIGGGTLVTTHPLTIDKNAKGMNASQQIGAAETYARRYSLSAVLGISAEEDTGGGANAGRHTKDADKLTPDWRDPSNDGMGTGVKGADLPPGATPQEKAEAFAAALEKKFRAAKTSRGLSGEWDRNDKVIQRLDESYNGLYMNLIDVFTASMQALTEAEKGPDDEAA